MTLDTEYIIKLVVRKGDVVQGWAGSTFVWTNTCESFTHYAENDSTVIK
jgi:hypothetical protein